MQNFSININGQILSHENAKISVFDRGFLYGDSLYEVARTVNGKLFKVDEHLVRLQKSAQLCKINLSQPLDLYKKEMIKTVDSFSQNNNAPHQEYYCRIILTRGIGEIGFAQSCVKTPTQFVIIVMPLPSWTDEMFNAGIHLKIVKRFRNHPQALDPAMKSGNYLNSLLAYLEAHEEEKDVDDALLCNFEGFVTEGTTFNVFYVKKGVIVTPPLEIGILDGITRKLVLQSAKELKIPIRESYFTKEHLYHADEVFVTSTIKDVFPVTKVDQFNVNQKNPGKITQILNNAFTKKHLSSKQ